MNPLSSGTLAQMACLLELTAKKPGNVHRGADFDDAHFLDFALSAAVIGPAFDRSTGSAVGLTILEAVKATRRVTQTNTNLGMILLLAPLVKVPVEIELAVGVERILAATTVEDAQFVYQAIRLANPAGLGSVENQDVANQPSATLTEAMRLAADRDLIARQYANGYREVFDFVFPALKEAIRRGDPLESAIVCAQLTTMAQYPDSLIARKRGIIVAEEASRRARLVLESRMDGLEFDAWLRADGHARNPGATADLVTAAIYAALREGTISLPLEAKRWDRERFS